MSFINQALLYGLAGISIPIILHLLNRRSAKQIEWGAMLFLLDSVESRRRRIQLEEALLLAARCLLCGLVALAVARPFQPPGGTVPYVIVLPAFLISLVMITTGIILRETRKYFWWLVGGGLALLLVSGLAVAYEQYWNLKRFGNSGKKDIVLIIDGSTSMQIQNGGTTNFDRAVQEAREVVEKSAGGNGFSIILGGPVPLVKISDPVVNKNDVGQVLDSLKPMQGKMDGFGALSTAMTALNRGSNLGKEIIVFTDGQALGWNLDTNSAWEALKGSADQLKTKPPIIYRKFTLPTAFRNVSVSNLKFSRDVIGTDRAVGIDVTLENTGTEAISPTSLELNIGDAPKEVKEGAPAAPADENFKQYKEVKLNQLQPGMKETVHFSHKFKGSGAQVVSARVVVNDDLSLDNLTQTVASVKDRLRVLIVEGNPGADVLQRAATFTSLALAPSTTLSAASKAVEKNEQKNQDKGVKPGALLDPEVVPHTRLPSMKSFANYDVVVLCNVPRLADSASRRLAAWVQAGGGLLIAPGGESEAAFYNAWKTADGLNLLPGKMLDQKVIAADKDPLHLALNTFSHPALKLVADAKQSDLGGTVLQKYWRVDAEGPLAVGASVGGRLANGDPFLTMRPLGIGSVMLSSAGFDTGSGNLATRQAFVPLLHQLVYYLTAPDGQPLQRQPAQQISLALTSSNAEGGLKADFFRGKGWNPPAISSRVENKTDVNYSEKGTPGSVGKDNFSVRLTGALLPRYSEEYRFDGWGDDGIDVYLDDKKIISRGGEGKAKLEAGKYVAFRIDFTQTNGNATWQLNWSSQSQPREIIPADALLPFLPGEDTKESVVGNLVALGPDRVARQMPLIFTRAGLQARLNSDVIPGIYRIKVPDERRADLAKLLNPAGELPFSVADDPAESRLAQWTEQQLAMVKSHFEFFQPKEAKEITNILAGREFGEELWKYLALGALFILLAEVALTRWIALNRRAGEEVSLDFEHKFTAPKQFTDQLSKIKAATAA